MADLGTMTATLGITVKGLNQVQAAVLNTLKRMKVQIDVTNAKMQALAGTAPAAVDKGMETATKSVNSFTRTLGLNAQRLRTFGYLVSTTITLPIIAAGRSIVKASSAFHKSSYAADL